MTDTQHDPLTENNMEVSNAVNNLKQLTRIYQKTVSTLDFKAPRFYL